MGNATSAGLGSEAPHDERDIRSVGGQNSDTRPDDTELAEEAKESEVINRKSNLDSKVPASYNITATTFVIHIGEQKKLLMVYTECKYFFNLSLNHHAEVIYFRYSGKEHHN